MITCRNPSARPGAGVPQGRVRQRARRTTTPRASVCAASGKASLPRVRACMGRCSEQQFARLAEGQHPETGEQLVRHQTAREYVNEQGDTVRTMEHRAGWDATFSAPKSVSLTALVGGDDRVKEAHRESVRVALDEMEKYAQARMGGNVPAQTTGAWVVGQVRARQQPSGGRLRRAAVAHAHGDLQYRRDRRRKHAGVAAAGALQDAAVRDGGLPFGACRRGCRRLVTRSSAASMDSRRSRVTRASIWRRRVRGVSRSPNTWRRRAARERRRRRSRRTRRATRSCDLNPAEVQAQHRALAAEHGHQPQHVIEEAHSGAGCRA